MMFRFVLALFMFFMPFVAHAAICETGEYLAVDECVRCTSGNYCPGDDALYSCPSLWNDVSDDVKLWGVGHSSPVGAASPDDCTCLFRVVTDELAATEFLYQGKCTDGPSSYFGVHGNACNTGYYAYGEALHTNTYEKCVPCTNAPVNTVYTTAGTANNNNCSWKCADGYIMNADGAECAQLCTLGYTHIKTSTGLSIPLFSTKRTTPSINIGNANVACHADLALGRAQGAINVTYNGDVYHTVESIVALQCDAGYWLNGDACTICGQAYYCPGNNTRISCTDVILYEENVPSPIIYTSSSNITNTTAAECMCDWLNLSDERRVNYRVIGKCVDGMNASAYTGAHIYYDDCRSGYYAIRPKGWWNWYTDCAPCTNGPANSHYTSYSTPSVVGAVESNCPWECDDGYALTPDGASCVAIE